MYPTLKDNDIVLFQGDSITDAGRSREDDTELGHGYAARCAAWFAALHPDVAVTFINKGISGNRVKDLRMRWQEDCLDLKPTWVSILIGVNDTWRRYDSNDATTTADFERDYHAILTDVKQKLNANLVIIEPFVLPTPPDRAAWREDLDPKIGVARKLAREFGAIYIPMDGIFAAVSAQRPSNVWLADGVHPTAAGHALITKTWLEAVGAF